MKVFPESVSPLSRQMPYCFQAEIDRTMEQGLAGTDDYLNQWHGTAKLERRGDPAEILDALIQELEADGDSGGSE